MHQGVVQVVANHLPGTFGHMFISLLWSELDYVWHSFLLTYILCIFWSICSNGFLVLLNWKTNTQERLFQVFEGDQWPFSNIDPTGSQSANQWLLDHPAHLHRIHLNFSRSKDSPCRVCGRADLWSRPASKKKKTKPKRTLQFSQYLKSKRQIWVSNTNPVSQQSVATNTRLKKKKKLDRCC